VNSNIKTNKIVTLQNSARQPDRTAILPVVNMLTSYTIHTLTAEQYKILYVVMLSLAHWLHTSYIIVLLEVTR